MAKFTRTGARAPLAEGSVSMSAGRSGNSSTQFYISTPCEVAGTAKHRRMSLALSVAEAQRFVEFFAKVIFDREAGPALHDLADAVEEGTKFK